MKSVVILYECNSKYAEEKSFGGLSAKQLCDAEVSKIAENIVRIKNCDSVLGLVSALKNACEENQADYVVFSYDDLPFFNVGLAEKLIKSHEDYKAEYTYSDGYPYGLGPEIIDRGTLGILEAMAASSHKAEGEKAVSRDCIYNLIKTEINSFEVEAVLADEDWRLLRLAFHCGKKENYLGCVALYEEMERLQGNGADGATGDAEPWASVAEKGIFAKGISADEISKIASGLPGALKTVPGFYNIQIADFVAYDAIYTPYNKAYEEKYGISPMKSSTVMSFEDFSGLIDKIAQFSDTAVVSLSAWGEAFAHKDILKMIEKVLSYKGLSVYIETDGYSITSELCDELVSIVDSACDRTNGWDKLMVAVSLDSVSSGKYKAVHQGAGDDGFEKAIDAISLLSEKIPSAVYPQFVRMNDNEDELESFFRYWNEPENVSGTAGGTGEGAKVAKGTKVAKGHFIIQKYDDFAGELPDRKPADLAPLERDPCWHLRRDLTILSNGDVPLCRSYLFSNIVGNVFQQPIEDLWDKLNGTLVEHINKTYNDKCGKCDEYYTFNF